MKLQDVAFVLLDFSLALVCLPSPNPPFYNWKFYSVMLYIGSMETAFLFYRDLQSRYCLESQKKLLTFEQCQYCQAYLIFKEVNSFCIMRWPCTYGGQEWDVIV